MTIIAYRHGILATDSGVFSGNTYLGSAKKALKNEAGWLGAATGTAFACTAFKVWFLDITTGAYEKPFHVFSDSTNDYFMGLLVKPNGDVFYIDKHGQLMSVDNEYHVLGSGQEIALGAFAMGATAEQAVAATIQHGKCCTGDIQTVRLPIPYFENASEFSNSLDFFS